MPLGALYCGDKKNKRTPFHRKQIRIIISSTYILVVLRPYTTSTYFICDGCRYHHNNKILCIRPSIDNVEKIKTINESDYSIKSIRSKTLQGIVVLLRANSDKSLSEQ